MARKRYSPEQIIAMLREAEVRLSQGETIKKRFSQSFINSFLLSLLAFSKPPQMP